MARVALTDDNGALYGAPATWLDGRFALKGDVGGVEKNAALVGAPLYAYGHSYVAGTGATDPLLKWTSIFQRELMGASVQYNRAVSGHTMEQTSVEAVASASRRWLPGDKGVVILDSVLNNVLRTDAANADYTVTSFRNALSTTLRVLRSSAYVLNTDPSITYTGTWGTVAWPTSRTGNLRGSGAIGDSFTITGYTDTEVGLMLWAGKLPTSVEARFEVYVGGVKHGNTIDLSNIWQFEGDFYPNGQQPMYCHWVTGLPAGTKDVEVRQLASSAGTNKTLYLDGYLRPSVTPPTVLVVKDAPVVNYNGAALGNAGADILLTRLNRVVDDVVASFNRPGEVVAAEAGIGWVPSTMLGGVTGSDALHPNDSGHAAIAKSVYRAALGLPYRKANFA